MMGRMQDHPLYQRLRTVSLKECSLLTTSAPLERADREARNQIFKEFARILISGRNERSKYGFSSNTAGEVSRALEQAFQAGQRSAQDKTR